MNYKTIVMIFAAVMLLIGAGCGEQSQNNINTNSTGKDKVIIGFDENFPPFGFKDEAGNIVGFDIDLAKETMKRLDCEVEFKSIDWANKENELNSGNVDIIWNGLEIVGDRERYILFSKPYMISDQVVFVHHNSQLSLIANKSNLAGSIIGVQADSTAETHLNLDNELRYTLKELRRYSDNATAFEDLANRKIDAVIADEINGRYYVFRNGIDNKIDALNIPIGDEGKIAIGFRKSDTALCEEVQQAFDSMIKDGTAKKISKKWFGKDLILSN